MDALQQFYELVDLEVPTPESSGYEDHRDKGQHPYADPELDQRAGVDVHLPHYSFLRIGLTQLNGPLPEPRSPFFSVPSAIRPMTPLHWSRRGHSRPNDADLGHDFGGVAASAVLDSGQNARPRGDLSTGPAIAQVTGLTDASRPAKREGIRRRSQARCDPSSPCFLLRSNGLGQSLPDDVHAADSLLPLSG